MLTLLRALASRMRVVAERAARGPTVPRLGLAVVHGRSMEPTLHVGDRLLVLHGGRPRVGALLVVRLPDGVVAVKRAVRREPGGWWVERDNPLVGVDSWGVGAVPDRDVVARVLVRVRRGGRGGA